MNGQLDFTASLRARCALLRDTPASVFDEIKPAISLTPGARELTRALKALGATLAVLSGGFVPLVEWVARDLGLDHAHANNVRCSSPSLGHALE